MLHKYPILARITGFALVGLYIFGLYFVFTTFIATPETAKVFDFGGAIRSSRSVVLPTYRDRLWRSADGGANWTLAFDGQDQHLDALDCPTSETCFAAGPDYGSAEDSDTYSYPVAFEGFNSSGKHWITRTLKLYGVAGDSEDSGPYNGAYLSCPSENICYILGDEQDGSVLSFTTDQGDHWTTRATGASYGDLVSLSCPAEQVCFAVGRDGLVMKTTDGGKNWVNQKSATDGNLSGIKCASTKFCLSYGWSGLVVVTRDGGDTWVRKNAGAFRYSTNLACPAENTCYISGYVSSSSTSIKLLATRDGGDSWKTLDFGSKENISGISCAGADTCYLVTGHVNLKVTRDGGDSWEDLKTIGEAGFTGISCPARNNCYLATYTKS